MYQVSFHIVYILEAHAQDEWNISVPDQVMQHQNLQDRQHAARRIIEKFDLESLMQNTNRLHIWVDSFPQNSFQSYFHAWPLRVVLIDSRGVFSWASTPTDTGHFIPSTVTDVLEPYIMKNVDANQS